MCPLPITLGLPQLILCELGTTYTKKAPTGGVETPRTAEMTAASAKFSFLPGSKDVRVL